jgi:hypothetical protein
MKTYEYIQIPIDVGDLTQLNSLGSVGFRLVQIFQTSYQDTALLEREIEK